MWGGCLRGQHGSCCVCTELWTEWYLHGRVGSALPLWLKIPCTCAVEYPYIGSAYWTGLQGGAHCPTPFIFLDLLSPHVTQDSGAPGCVGRWTCVSVFCRFADGGPVLAVCILACDAMHVREQDVPCVELRQIPYTVLWYIGHVPQKSWPFFVSRLQSLCGLEGLCALECVKDLVPCGRPKLG